MIMGMLKQIKLTRDTQLLILQKELREGCILQNTPGTKIRLLN